MATAGVPDPNQQDQFQPWLPNNPTYSPAGYNPYPYGGFDPNSNGGTGNGVDTSQMGYAPSGNEADVDPNASMEKIYAANRDTINTTGNTLGQEGGNELNYYGGQTVQDQTAQNNALNQLQQTPGYTSPEAGQINVDYSQFNTTPAQYSAIAGDPNAPVTVNNAGVANEQGAEGAYQSTLGTDLNSYQGNLGAQVGQAQGWEGGAANQFGQGLTSAQSKFGALDSAVSNPDLGFDPNGTEKQMSDQDVQNMVTSAGTTVGNQFQTAEDTLERQAAAQGNTSPAALAALRQNLVTQEAATAGDTMTNANIAAQNAQYSRASGIEGQREGAVDTQTGLKATAATTEEAAAQAAAGQAGQATINEANLAAGQGIDAANTYGQFSTGQEATAGQQNVGQQNTQTGQQYGAASTAEQLGSTRAQQTATMQNQQGVTAATDTSAGAKTVGDARIAGQGAYRSGVAGQQQLAQSGANQAQQTQLGAYGTQTSGANSAASGQGNFEVGKPSLGDTLAKGVASGVQAVTGFETGGVADNDMVAKVGERGPEWVGPMNAVMREGVRYGGSRRKPDDDEEMFGVAA